MSSSSLVIAESGSPRRHSAWSRLKRSDFGVLPLIIACPLMYAPKVLEGDTQPWVILAALYAFLTYRTRRFLQRSDLPLVLLSALCVMVYALRSGFGPDLLRATYIQVTFIVLWVVCRRDGGDLLPATVRLTVIVWLAVGIYQYVFVALNLPVEFVGRYVEGRSGVPSLTSEASTYGSLSVLQIMYLLSQKNPRNSPYIAASALSVVLSGSLLAFALLLFPLMKLRLRWRVALVLVFALLVFVDYMLTEAGITSRLMELVSPTSGIAAAVLDPSLNLRLGHIYFTLFENLVPSLLLSSPIDFMTQYNSFARSYGIFMDTGNNFILTGLGDLIYGSGIVGALLMIAVIRRAQAQSSTRAQKFEKAVFILACMLNPIYLSNIFLVMYAQRGD